ncbi:MAG TPA: flagellar hook-length control protein FliK, partial [Solirubrobacteraceae bacterium]|nr:flagellar hook-length control protein FliK [Solirubrobacteraceae bacterium]
APPAAAAVPVVAQPAAAAVPPLAAAAVPPLDAAGVPLPTATATIAGASSESTPVAPLPVAAPVEAGPVATAPAVAGATPPPVEAPAADLPATAAPATTAPPADAADAHPEAAKPTVVSPAAVPDAAASPTDDNGAAAREHGSAPREQPATTQAPVSAAPAPAAPAAQPTAPTLPATPLDPRTAPLHQAPRAVAQVLQVAVERGISHARLNLRPAELGGIEIRLQTSAAGVTAQVIADSPEAARLLHQAADDLRRSLERHDVTLLSLDVSTAGDDRPDGSAGASADLAGDRARHFAAHGVTPPAATEADAPPPVVETVQLPDGLHVDVLA